MLKYPDSILQTRSYIGEDIRTNRYNDQFLSLTQIVREISYIKCYEYYMLHKGSVYKTIAYVPLTGINTFVIVYWQLINNLRILCIFHFPNSIWFIETFVLVIGWMYGSSLLWTFTIAFALMNTKNSMLCMQKIDLWNSAINQK